jgi:hypothetical protein
MDFDFETLKRRADEKLHRRIAEAEAEHRDTIRALETVRQLAKDEVQGGNVHAQAATAPTTPRATSMPRGNELGPTAMVRQAVNSLPGDFSMRDVADFIKRHFDGREVKRVSISSALNKLAMQQEIRQTVPGAGKLPAKYQRVNGQQPLMEGTE